jgi:hypothetical protein
MTSRDAWLRGGGRVRRVCRERGSVLAKDRPLPREAEGEVAAASGALVVVKEGEP